MNEKALFERLDHIICLLQGAAAGTGILGILSVIDVIKSWLGG